MNRLRDRLTYANVISTLALFLALGGGAALAATKIHTGNIAKGAVKTSKLHQRAVTSGKLAVGAVRSNQIADGAVGSSQLAGGAVGSPQIAAGAVGSGKIAAGAAGSNQIADGAVGTDKIAAGAVGSNQIADGAVGTRQIGTKAVAPSNLQVPLNFVAGPTGGSTTLPPAAEEIVPYPLTGAGWTQEAGQVEVIFGEGVATLAWNGVGGGGSCQVRVYVGTGPTGEGGENGGQFRTESAKPVTIEANLGGLPLIDPTSARSRQLSASIETNGGCTVGSTIDSTRFRVLGFG